MADDLYTYRATLVRVVDGDTVVMRLDMGFRCSCEQSLRLVGVNAPELFSGINRAVGAWARDDCSNWFSDTIVEGENWPWTVRTQKDRQTFGRYLGYVYAITGESLNAHLAAQPWQEATA